jgi:hypothetical protein
MGKVTLSSNGKMLERVEPVSVTVVRFLIQLFGVIAIGVFTVKYVAPVLYAIF